MKVFITSFNIIILLSEFFLTGNNAAYQRRSNFNRKSDLFLDNSHIKGGKDFPVEDLIMEHNEDFFPKSSEEHGRMRDLVLGGNYGLHTSERPEEDGATKVALVQTEKEPEGEVEVKTISSEEGDGPVISVLPTERRPLSGPQHVLKPQMRKFGSIGKFIQGIWHAPPDIIQGISEGVQAIGTLIVQLPGQLVNAGMVAVQSGIQHGIKAVEYVVKGVGAAVQAGVNHAQKFVEEMASGKLPTAAALDQIIGFVEETVDIAKGVGGQVMDEARGFVVDVVNASRPIIGGLINTTRDIVKGGPLAPYFEGFLNLTREVINGTGTFVINIVNATIGDTFIGKEVIKFLDNLTKCFTQLALCALLPVANVLCFLNCLMGAHPVMKGLAAAFGKFLQFLCDPLGTIFDGVVQLLEDNFPQIKRLTTFLTLFGVGPAKYKTMARDLASSVEGQLIKFVNGPEVSALRPALGQLNVALDLVTQGISFIREFGNPACHLITMVDAAKTFVDIFYRNPNLLDIILAGYTLFSVAYSIIPGPFKELLGAVNMALNLFVGVACGLIYYAEQGRTATCDQRGGFDSGKPLPPGFGGPDPHHGKCGAVPYFPPFAFSGWFSSIFPDIKDPIPGYYPNPFPGGNGALPIDMGKDPFIENIDWTDGGDDGGGGGPVPGVDVPCTIIDHATGDCKAPCNAIGEIIGDCRPAPPGICTDKNSVFDDLLAICVKPPCSDENAPLDGFTGKCEITPPPPGPFFGPGGIWAG